MYLLLRLRCLASASAVAVLATCEAGDVAGVLTGRQTRLRSLKRSCFFLLSSPWGSRARAAREGALSGGEVVIGLPAAGRVLVQVVDVAARNGDLQLAVKLPLQVEQAVAFIDARSRSKTLELSVKLLKPPVLLVEVGILLSRILASKGVLVPLGQEVERLRGSEVQAVLLSVKDVEQRVLN